MAEFGKWYPVGKSPEVGQLVAVYSPDAMLSDVWPAYWNGRFFDAGGGWFEQDEVVAWMPLPPPPGANPDRPEAER